MGNPLCPTCGETGRLVQLQEENIEFYWCGECFVKWPSRPESAPASAQAPHVPAPEDRDSHQA